MVKKIIWSKLAQADRKSILKYWIIRNQSNNYSISLNQLFMDTVDLLSKYPKIGKKTEYPDIRIKIIKKYFLTYRETESSIEILTIWDSRQDSEKFDIAIKNF
jgi:toxin YoeB